MKIKSAVKRLCEHCYMVRRGKTLYVRCTKNPRHKQRQGFATLATRGPPFGPKTVKSSNLWATRCWSSSGLETVERQVTQRVAQSRQQKTPWTA